MIALLAALLALGPAEGLQDDPTDKLQALPDFKLERVLKADPKVHGSWIALGRDGEGRLLLCGQRNQPVTRVTIKDGKVESAEDAKLPVSEIMGLTYAFGALYVSGQGPTAAGKSVFGLFRVKDGQAELLREWKGGPGEHGAHGLVAGPDGKLYAVNGNFTAPPSDLLPSSPHRNYADDRILPRAEDGNGFGAGHKPPGGYVVRMDPDGKNAELVAAGQRNCYDIAFNADGELFGFDSDMEWDWGTPWYRPTRVFHVVSGADHGFREGTAKWPEHYADSLPATVNIGVGSPTGVVFGTGAKFPAKYQKALYILDWSYGRLMAVHLEPDGASYRGTFENFVAPKFLKGGGPKVPLNVTDVVIGEDGALYFTVGGRNTQAALYRVSYTGSASTAPADLHDGAGAELRARRRAFEAHHVKADPGALDTLLQGLDDPDRFVRYAARIAVERHPVEVWKAKALASGSPAALLALARVGPKELQPEVLRALPKAPANEGALLDKLRVIQVSVARHGAPPEDVARALAADLNPLYPAKSAALNAELCQVLLALGAPEAVAKTVDLLGGAATLEEEIGYVLHLRTAAKGWTPELRKSYFGWWLRDHGKAGHSAETRRWFEDAGRGYGDGASFPKFLANFHAAAKATLTPEEAQAVGDVVAAYVPPGVKARTPSKARTLVKEWKFDDLQPALDQVAKDRSWERGKEVYETAQCILCHKFGAEGGAVGADLTAVASRYSRRDILEAIVDPSKVISEQYQNTLIRTTDGTVIDGRLLEETGDKLVLQPNPLKPEKVTVRKGDVDKRMPSKVSPMPPGLVNAYTREEILDLLAYLEAGGRKDHPAFAALRKASDVTDRVAAALKDGKLAIAATNDNFGDPAPNEVKRLRVEYLDGDEAKSAVVGENQTLEIRASAGRKLAVKRALYGVFP